MAQSDGMAARLAALGLVLAIGACASTPAPGHSRGPVPVPRPFPPEDAKFARFVAEFRATALAAGIAPATYDAAMGTVARNQRVEDLNENQPEFVKPVWAYLDSAVSPRRIADGQAMLAANAAMLADLETRFGVPGNILVSIWGNESNYGRLMGRFNMFEALATLAYDGPRADYARSELIAALKMMQRQGYAPANMTSSWAGAFGQTQFVPSSFFTYAVDGDHDGRIDLWASPADALASTANLLVQAGWRKGKPWGYEVVLPPGFAYDEADLDTALPIAAWRKRGVKTATGGALPPDEEAASIYLPAGARGPAFLVFPNFKVLLKYNNAASYALAVCLLADRIAGGPAVAGNWPRDDAPLSRDERFALQAALIKLGYPIGNADGILGQKTRAAIRAYQRAHNLPPDGYPTEDLLTRIAMEAKRK